LSYFLPSFHPWQQDNRQALNQWLDAHRDRMMLIR
jgi:predicted metal-dependent hydrolase